MRTRKKGRHAPDGPPTSLLLFWLFLAFLYCQNGMMIPACLAQSTSTPGDVNESEDNSDAGSTTPSTTFHHFNDGEIALSKLNYGPEWYDESNQPPQLSQPSTLYEKQHRLDQLNQASDVTTEFNEYSKPPEAQSAVDSLCQIPEGISKEITASCLAAEVIQPELNKSNVPHEFAAGLLSQVSEAIPPELNGSSILSEVELPVNQSTELSESVSDQLNQSDVNSESNESYEASEEITSEFNESSKPPEVQSAVDSLSQVPEVIQSGLNKSNVPNDFAVGSLSQVSEAFPPELNESRLLSEVQLPVNQSTESNESLSEPDTPSQETSDLDEYKKNTLLCIQHGFRPPIHYKRFAKSIWNYVRTFNPNDLQPGYKFETLEDLEGIPRRFDKPFCRPGPEQRGELWDWYLSDSIVQKVYFKANPSPWFVVRWIGYEDQYNTVEPLANVKHTSIYKLFTCPDLYTACRSNNCCILRKSRRTVPQEVVITAGTSCEHKNISVPMDIDQSKYERAMNKLITELRVEEEAGRYSQEIGFCSCESVQAAQIAQHNFLLYKFHPIINELKSTLHLDNHYIGQACGNLNKASNLKQISKLGISNSRTIKYYINEGLSDSESSSSPHYVAFFVPQKLGTTEKKDKKQMNFHMCVLTVRSFGGVKEAIYFDPSPKFLAHGAPKVIHELKRPVFESFTKTFGVTSKKDDCMYQCMLYIIGIATGEVPFAPDLSEPCRRLDQFMEQRRSKKIKIENEDTKRMYSYFPNFGVL